MCPSLAEPDSRDIPRSEVSNCKPQANKKFFDPAIFQKCWRGVGEQPTFAKQIRLCNLFFLLQLHFLKLTNSQFHDFYETSCKFRQGNGAIAARWQAKAGVEPPFAGRCRPFSLRIILVMFHMKHCIATVPPEQLRNIRFLFRFHKAGRSCSPRLEKLSLFSPPPPCAKSMAQRFRCLRAAIRATRPHLASIFEKLLDQKTFLSPAARCLQPIIQKSSCFSPRSRCFFAKYPKNKMVRCKTLLHFLQSKFHHFSVFRCI